MPLLPGVHRLIDLLRRDQLGQVLSARIEFGYWVFQGPEPPAQRPSWNYKAEDGGGIVLDMFCHWRNMLAALFGDVERVCAVLSTHLSERWDELGRAFRATAEDAAYAIVIAAGIPIQLTASWCTRVRGRELFSVHVDGVNASAVASPSRCFMQSSADTPSVSWGSADETGDAGWKEVPVAELVSPQRAIWAEFLSSVADDRPFRASFVEGARDVQFAELARLSARERCWLDVPAMTF
jgi:predicted dehydrogenase